MHPNLTQGIAAERRADMRRAADAYRRGRVRPVRGQRRHAAHEHVANAASAGSTGTGSAPAESMPAYRAADKMLVLPDGTPDTAESTELCSAGR